MSPHNTTQLVLALLGFALVASAFGWSPYGRSVWPPVSVAALAAAAVVAAVADDLSADRVEVTILVTVAGLLAAVGGGPVTTRVFAFVDRSDRSDREKEGDDQGPHQTLDQAGEVLRGGA